MRYCSLFNWMTSIKFEKRHYIDLDQVMALADMNYTSIINLILFVILYH